MRAKEKIDFLHVSVDLGCEVKIPGEVIEHVKANEGFVQCMYC